MMRFLRSQSQTVLVIVLGVIGLGFLFYGNSGTLLTTSSGIQTNDYGRIDGDDLTVSDVYDAVRNTRYTLIMSGRMQGVTQAAVAQEAWRQLLLLHEADKLHIQIGNDELVKYIKDQTVFQKDGVFDPQTYQSRMTQLQAILRISPETGANPISNTEAAFETLMNNTLKVNAVSAALFSTVRTPSGEITDQYEKFEGPTTVSVITFDPKAYENTVQVTPEQIEQAYKANPANPAFRTKEKRKVDYVLFLLPADQAKLPDPQKKAAMEALGEKALQFALSFQPDPGTTGTTPPAPNFQDEAKKAGLPLATTEFFEVDAKPSGLPPSPSFNNAAFALTKDNDISKVVELDNGLAVLHLSEIQPSELLPLEKVKDDIAKQLKQVGSTQMAQTKAQEASQALKAAVAKGTDFKAAAAVLNLKTETPAAFVPTKAAPTDPKVQTYAYVASTLGSGLVSEPFPIQSANVFAVLHVDTRVKPDPAGLAAFETRYRTESDQQLRSYVYQDWANWKSRQHGTHPPPQLDRYGGIE